MSTKQKIIAAYLVIALCFAAYGALFGSHASRGFFYNLGMGVVWPAIIFPSLGWIVGGIIIVIFVALVSFS